MTPLVHPLHRPLRHLRTLLAGCVVLLALAGCGEYDVSEYHTTELGDWTQSPDEPRIISGSPTADAAAYTAASEDLSQADWRILEQLAPRPIWEQLHGRQAERARAPQHAATPRAARELVVPDVPFTELPNGRLRMVYRFQHAGAAPVTSRRDGGTERQVVQVGQADVSPLLNVITAELGDQGSVYYLPDDNAIVLTVHPELRDSILRLLAELDRPVPQVEITARVFEVSHDFDFQYGAHTLLSHIASDSTQALASTFSTQEFLESLSRAGGDFAYQGSALRLMQIFGDSGITLDVTLQALSDAGMIREVASPRMAVARGRTGYVLAGQELPIASARISSDQIVTEKTTYKPIGVQLYITPTTIGDNSVSMHVVTVVSAISGFRPRQSMSSGDTLQMLLNPILDSREAETSVTVDDGATLVIGGLRTVRTVTRERKVPGLGDIPILQLLFKNHRTQRHISDLYFFVTPRIINSSSM